MRFSIGWSLAFVASFGLVFARPEAALAQTTAAPTIETCRDLKDTEVRRKVDELAAASLKAEVGAIDYAALVKKHWAKANVDERIDKEVDEAIAAIKADSRWIDRAYSTVSQSAATRYAMAVSDKTYNSTGFKAALEEMATGVATE